MHPIGRKTISYLLAIKISILLSFQSSFATQVITPQTIKSEEIIQKTTPLLKEQFRKKKLVYGAPIFIRIFKESLELELWVKNGRKFKLFKTYYICDLSGSLGPKIREGDRQAPEGFYRVGPDQLNPWSNHHLSFNLGFPNEYDLAYQRTGSGLMVHGKCNSRGCFAMTNFRIEEIYTIADNAILHGQESFPVHIFPFRMTRQNLKKHPGKWSSFWKNLKEGYDFFEKTSIPPYTSVENCRYKFTSIPPLIISTDFPEEQVCIE